MKSVALALGGGGARGLSHIVVFEALDEMGVRPAAIAGTSIGALLGAAYASGMTGKEIRKHVMTLAHDRDTVFRGLMAARAGRIASLVTSFRSATLVDAEKFCTQFLPATLPDDLAQLPTPLTVIASDLYRRTEMPLSSGPLRRALAASMALPGISRPVVVDGRVLVDGGATNPLPFDRLRGRADLVLAVDVTGIPSEDRNEIPDPWECFLAMIQVTAASITAEKLKNGAPDLIIRPNVGLFRALDFLRASAILRASEPAKDEVKSRLGAML